jgi:murein DD-endopeptidase MepM/ murein hydrolase activator NlpD
MLRNLSSAVLAFLLAACGGESSTNSPTLNLPVTPVVTCEGFGDWTSSDYVLPFPIGLQYRINQGNCSGFGHSGFWAYGYDVVMPVGSTVTAARGGIVDHAQDGASDGDRSNTNLITIMHDDGTVALYSHLTLHGVLVFVGQNVAMGEVIGASGDTGNTGGLPHLHFSLHSCGALPGIPGTGTCPTIPVNFSNTDANPAGLVANRVYEALTF